jgi:hypothetical protein
MGPFFGGPFFGGGFFEQFFVSGSGGWLRDHLQNDFADYVRRKQRELEELEEDERRVIAERAAVKPTKRIVAADMRAFKAAGLQYRNQYAELLAFERQRLEEEAIVMTMIAALSA